MRRLVLPYPPSGNRYWRHWRNRVVRSPIAAQYIGAVQLRAKAEKCQPVDGSCAVLVLLYRPAKRGDLDNSLKVLLDSLRGVLYRDDSQIEFLCARRREDKDHPRAEVQVWETKR